MRNRRVQFFQKKLAAFCITLAVLLIFGRVPLAQAQTGSASVNATVPAICGNGALEGGEQCDDGNESSGDGCSSACVREGGGVPPPPPPPPHQGDGDGDAQPPGDGDGDAQPPGDGDGDGDGD